MGHQIDVYFDFKSSYSHLAAQVFPALAEKAGVAVAWRPVQFDDGYRAHAVPVPHPRPAKMRQVYFDLKRRSKRFGVPFKLPTKFPTETTGALCVARLAAREGWGTAFVQATFLAYYGGPDRDVGDPRVVQEIISALCRDGARVYELARAEREPMREDARRAAELGVIGAPAFVVGRDVFWGHDRMDDALEACLALAGPTG